MVYQAIRQQDLAVIVEGYTDVITTHQNGFNNVVASMGTAVTEKQISTLKRLTKNMVLSLDADAAGEEAMLRCASYEDVLESEIKVIIMPKGKDPDNVIREDPDKWQHMLAEALPVEKTFDNAVAKLDLGTARDKLLAVERLLPIFAYFKDTIRREHYLNKLARLTGITYKRLEGELVDIMSKRRIKKPTQEVTAPVVRPLLAEPIEEYCLALLLQHPELKAQCQGLLPEYFADTQNREIFIAYMEVKDVKLIKEKLDSALHDYVDSLVRKSLTDTQIEPKFVQCDQRLREKFLRSLQAKNTEALRLAAESEGPAAELAKLEEQGTEISTQLGEVLAQKRQTGSGAKGVEK